MEFRNPALLVLHFWGDSAVMFSRLCNQLEMSWERRFVCSTKHGPKSINLGWKFIVTLQGNLILPFAAWHNPFRGAGVIPRDVQLDLTTASDLFDWWKWRGKCSGGGGGDRRLRHGKVWTDWKRYVTHFCDAKKEKSPQRKAERNKYAHLWLDCFENRSIHERNLTLKGIKDNRRQEKIQS